MYAQDLIGQPWARLRSQLPRLISSLCCVLGTAFACLCELGPPGGQTPAPWSEAGRCLVVLVKRTAVDLL